MGMNLPDRPAAAFAHLSVPVAELLAVARPRLARQRQYAQALAKGGRKAEALAGWIGQAADCIAALARPEVVLVPVPARPVPGGVLVAGHLMLEDEDIARDLAAGAPMTACLLTLNFGQEAAFDFLGRDYALHHVQSALAGETLFALARAADRIQRAGAPGRRLVRVPVQAHAECGARRVWEPAQVQAMLGLFAAANPNVTMTETGFFRPLHSLLSLTVLR